MFCNGVRAAAALLVTVGTGCEPGAVSDAPRLWNPKPGHPLVVCVTGDEFNWLIRYPGPDGELDTADDILAKRHLHLPSDTKVELQLRSKDYVYSLYLPHRKLREVAVPDISFSLDFVTASAGRHELLGSQMCGYTHPNLIGKFVVQTPGQFEAWLRGL